jgi:hypothetical protein
MKSMKLMRRSCAVFFAFALAGGCAYKIPIKDNEPTATIRFVDPRNVARGRSLIQAPTKITLLDEGGCTELGHVAGIGSFNDYKMELTVPAQRKLFFQWFTAAPALGGTWHCKLVKGFSPEAGQLYEARFDLDLDRQACTVDLVKISAGAGGAAGAARVPMLSKSLDACKGTSGSR